MQFYKAKYFNLLKAFDEISEGHQIRRVSSSAAKFLHCIWLLGNHWLYSGPQWWTHRQADYYPWSHSANVTKNGDKKDTISNHGTRPKLVSCSTHLNVLMYSVNVSHDAASWKKNKNPADKLTKRAWKMKCFRKPFLKAKFHFCFSHCTIICLWWFVVSPSAQLCLWTLDTFIMELWAAYKLQIPDSSLCTLSTGAGLSSLSMWA